MYSSTFSKYLSYVKSRCSSWYGLNSLDRERCEMCKKAVENVSEGLRKQKCNSGICRNRKTFCKKIEYVKKSLEQLKELMIEPQGCLPDIFLWVIQGNRRIAYHRIPARNLLFSPVPEERGQDCAKVRSYYLKLPSRKCPGHNIWRIQGQVTAVLWLGLNSGRRGIIAGIPNGYEITADIQCIHKPNASIPLNIKYTETYTYTLRCHLYQARSLLAADYNGLSDPFARVLFMGYCAISQTIEKTRNPFWDQTLEIENVTCCAVPSDLVLNTPNVVIELFDQNKIGPNSFIGQALAQPVVKSVDDPYVKPKFPPPLQWFPVYRGTEHGGEILAAFELIQQNKDGTQAEGVPVLNTIHNTENGPVCSVPEGIRPPLTKYKIEVLFWGLRDMQKVNFLSVSNPRVEIRCCGQLKPIMSDVITDYKRNPNFTKMFVSADVKLPQNPTHWPSIEIQCIDCRSFGRDVLVGTHTIEDIQQLLCDEKAEDATSITTLENFIAYTDGQPPLIQAKDMALQRENAAKQRKFLKNRLAMPFAKQEHLQSHSEQLDWWSKYFTSIQKQLCEEKMRNTGTKDEEDGIVRVSRTNTSFAKKSVALTESLMKRVTKQRNKIQTMQRKDKCAEYLDEKANMGKLKVYNKELELIPEFGGFHDWIATFPLYRGRNSTQRTDRERQVGKFKGQVRISALPFQGKVKNSFFQHGLKNETVQVHVRVYIIRGINFHPTDYNGKADPYLYLTLGKTKISDKENYISKQLNPTFGKCFEFHALFPQESQLLIQVYDWDLMSRDDLIGETRIDLEDRFYSRHRATCGLAEKYDISGYNKWRDPLKPSQILEKLCNQHKLAGPYYMPGQVKIGSKTFTPSQGQDEGEMDTEDLALYGLHHWNEIPLLGYSLVPEHVETRSLYNPDKPGMVTGRLEMWIDMFPVDLKPPPPVNIAPRKPKSFELHVIIWNTEDVVLDDRNFLTGEKMSDIYVKGWLKSQNESQATDVHYRSLTGEGNFNWRFIFPFDYLEAEQKIVFSRRETLFSIDKTEIKVPPVLTLQVWDADYVMPDDFLGSLELNLTNFPRGSKTSHKCTLELMNDQKDGHSINLFQQRRTKGWWPFMARNSTGLQLLTGKVEAEIHLLTQDEAAENPAGLGRNAPNPLEEPYRPDSSFVWFTNPLKSVRLVMWANYKWKIVKILLVILLILMFFLFVYSLPGYIAKRVVDA